MPSSNTSAAADELRAAQRTLKTVKKMHAVWQTPPDAGPVRRVCSVCSGPPWPGPLAFPCPTHKRLETAITRLEFTLHALTDD